MILYLNPDRTVSISGAWGGTTTRARTETTAALRRTVAVGATGVVAHLRA